MQNLIHLRRKLLINAGDHLLDGVKDVILDNRLIPQRFADERCDRIFNFGRRAFRARLEALLQQSRKILRFVDLNLLRNFGLGDFIGHD